MVKLVLSGRGQVSKCLAPSWCYEAAWTVIWSSQEETVRVRITSTGPIKGRKAKWPSLFLKSWPQSPWEKSTLNSQQTQKNSAFFRTKACQEKSTILSLTLKCSYCHLESLIPFWARILPLLASSLNGKWFPGRKASFSICVFELSRKPWLMGGILYHHSVPYNSPHCPRLSLTYKWFLFPYFTFPPFLGSDVCFLLSECSTCTVNSILPNWTYLLPLLIHNQMYFYFYILCSGTKYHVWESYWLHSFFLMLHPTIMTSN